MNKLLIIIPFIMLMMAAPGLADGSLTCYQETANVSNACGGLGNGTYAFTGDVFHTPEEIIDGNWTTWAWVAEENNYHIMYVNYSIPAKAINATWEVRDKAGSATWETVNLTIPSECFNREATTLMLKGYIWSGFTGNISWDCYNGSNWNSQRVRTGLRGNLGLSEEAIIWNYAVNTSLFECNATHTDVAYVFVGKNETDLSNVSYDLNGYIEYWDGVVFANTTISNTSSVEHKICIDPDTAAVNINATFSYSAPGYATRWWYLENSIASNETQVINLYLINETESKEVTVYVKNQNDLGVPNSLVKFSRYYADTGAYILTSMSKTDYSGSGSAYLDSETWYKPQLQRNSIIIKNYDPLWFNSQSSLTFTTSASQLPEVLDYWNNIAYGCNYNNDTYVLSCDVTDTSGTLVNTFLNVTRIGVSTNQTVCSDSAAGSSVTLICTIPDNSTYSYKLLGNFGNSWWNLGSGVVGNNQSQKYGTAGLLLGFLIIIGFAAIGSFNPATTIIFSIMGVGVSLVFGLFNASSVTWGAFFGLCLAGGIIVWRMYT